MHIFLYGPPGTGKSTVGKKLAGNLKLPFIDLDRVIETNTGMAISRIMEQQGESIFRDLETAALKEAVGHTFSVTNPTNPGGLQTRPTLVIALGGGALLRDENRTFAESTIYLLDEPTVGLHYEDVRKLIEILQKLVDKGNSVLTIEHNMDIIKSADYCLDIGPEGGAGGGQIVARGTPEQIAANPKSHTGYYLKKVLKKKK